MIEVKEILRLWLDGRSQREVSKLTTADRKTVRRYVETARACGVDRDGDLAQLTDPAAHGGGQRGTPPAPAWAWRLVGGAGRPAWAAQGVGRAGLTLAKVHMLLGRRGIVVSYRTLYRYATSELGFGRRRATVPVADGEPGAEVQVDFGRLGLISDPTTGTKRVVGSLAEVPDDVCGAR